jgi:hypothetical protein
MSFQAALIIAAFVIFVAVFFVLLRVIKGRSQAKEEELRKAALLRGWTFEEKTERGFRIYRYSGTTEGVAWEAESARPVAGHNHDDQPRFAVAKWHGKWSPGVTAPIVAIAVPKGKEGSTTPEAQMDGFFAGLVVKLAGLGYNRMLDAYFGDQIGKEIDAAALRRVESAAVPGFIVMAGNVDEASRILSEGLKRALVDASSTPGHVLADKNRPFVLVWPQGISLARLKQFRDIAEVERFIHAGVGLTRGFRFGRRA